MVSAIWRRMGNRFELSSRWFADRGGFAGAYKSHRHAGLSSAVFNFVPKLAMDFYHATAADDHATVNRLPDEFFLPYLEIRNRVAGYAVSIVAGARLVGHSGGPVRAPFD